MRVEHLLKAASERAANRIAIAAGRGRHTYAELDRKSDRLAGALSATLHPGDRVALFLDDSFPAVVAIFGVFKAGMVAVPIPASFPETRLADWLVAERVVGIMTEARLATRVATALGLARAVRLLILAGGDRAATSGSCLAYEDVVMQLDTPEIAPQSGEGEAVVFAGADDDADSFTHAELAAAVALGRLHPDATITADAPLAMHDGFHQMLCTLAAGATFVLGAGRYGRRNERLRTAERQGALLHELAS